MKELLDKIKKFTIKNKKWIFLSIFIIVFLIIANNIINKDIMEIDNIGNNIVTKYLRNDFVTEIAKFITNFGGAIYLCTIAVILLIVIKNKRIGVFIILNLLIEVLLNVILKNILQRPRPIEINLIEESGYSFPSGHSMASMAFYGFLIYLIYKNENNKYVKWTSIIILSLLIILIGISRIYLGVHYTSDVIAGFLIAISYLIIYTSLIKKFIMKMN